MVDFLLEIGCEELPHIAQKTLPEALRSLVLSSLNDHHLSFDRVNVFSTPRRLAVIIDNLQETQAPQKIERQGPAYDQAYDKGGAPTLTCLGFARSCGVTVDDLSVKETPKGKRLVYISEKPGNATKEIIPVFVNKIISKLPVSRAMRWGSGPTQFARPVRWVVLLLGNELIEAEILGLKTRRETQGHRFHYQKPISVTSANEYITLLSTKGFVIPDRETRKQLILKKLQTIQHNDCCAVLDEELLEEVTSLVEWPAVLMGAFDQRFLSVPKECLVTTMKLNQKCFSVVNANHELQNKFILVSNIVSEQPKAVIEGNERVIHARLSDAMFFYQQDCKTRLSQHTKSLDDVVFQDKLGSMSDKVARLVSLTHFIAKNIKLAESDIQLIKRAAALCKNDLVTNMVSEFPNLQGIMGYHYVLHDGEAESVAVSIRDHYQPRFSGDYLPKTNGGDCLAVADRIDTLVGIIGINGLPSGDKDPFALRRAAAGLCRILIEKKYPLDVNALIEKAIKLYEKSLSNKKTHEQTLEFIFARLRSHYLDQTIASEVFEAVLACQTGSPYDFDKRVQAVLAFQSMFAAESLSAANKRVHNILKKQSKEKFNKIDSTLFDCDAEKKLSMALNKQSKVVNKYCKESQYENALKALAELKEPIDYFFDQVMIMVDNRKKRENRLALLSSIRALFMKVADISLLP